MPSCTHLLCEIIGGTACSLASGRSRGCRPNLADGAVAPAVFDEVRALVAAIDPERRDDRSHPHARAAAVRLAELVRREAREDRQLVAIARDADPELAEPLARLCRRRR